MPKKSVLPVVTATVNFVADDTKVVYLAKSLPRLQFGR